MVERIYHVGLTVSDLDRSIAFYRDILGLEVQGEIFMAGEETDRLFRMKDTKARVAYLNGSKAMEAPPIELIQFVDNKVKKVKGNLFTTSISEVCFYTDDIERVYNSLIENHVECLSEPQYFDFRANELGESKAFYFRDLVAVQVQDRQNNAVRHRIEELVAVPRGCQRAGLRLAVTDNHGCDQVGVIQHRTEAVRQRITQFTALVDGARGLRGNVAGNAARERELLEQALHALGVLADVRVNLAVSALEVGVRHEEVAAVTRTGQQDHIQIILLDDAVQMNVNQVLTGHRAPVADDLLLDVLGLQRLLEQRVIEQVKLTGCKIICRPPVCVHFVQHFVVDVCCHSVMLPFCD